MLKIPSLKQAQEYIQDYKEKSLNELGVDPYKWECYEAHLNGVAEAAQKIASYTEDLHPEIAYIMGYLHDWCKFNETIEKSFHGVLAYKDMMKKGFDDMANICLTHNFSLKDFDKEECIRVLHFGNVDEYNFVDEFLQARDYTDYDLLIQLCDYLADNRGFVTIDKRVDCIVSRYGVGKNIKRVKKQLFDLKQYFEMETGQDVYELLSIE